VGIDKARFKRQVIPGDRLRIQVTVNRVRQGIWKFDCTASVDDAIACTAEVVIAKNEISD